MDVPRATSVTGTELYFESDTSKVGVGYKYELVVEDALVGPF